jgi:hypothetical protein
MTRQPITDSTIDSAVIENLSQRVAEQQAEIESLTAKLDAAKIELTTRKERGGECHKLLTAAGIPDNHGQGKHLAGRIQMLIARAEAAEAKLATVREALVQLTVTARALDDAATILEEQYGQKELAAVMRGQVAKAEKAEAKASSLTPKADHD